MIKTTKTLVCDICNLPIDPATQTWIELIEHHAKNNKGMDKEAHYHDQCVRGCVFEKMEPRD